MLKEFREFAVKGNAVDMAVGIIMGAAFGVIVKSLVSDVIMPPVGLLMGDTDFSDLFVVLKEGAAAAPYATLKTAKDAGAVTLNYGAFINTLVSFAVVAAAMFALVKGMNSLRRQEEAPPAEPTTGACPRCLSVIPLKATRCAHCTTELKAGWATSANP
ncbi:MAG: large-conductance mechanosensitive channel protein MscL [Thermodesulfovibrionales bacterium]